MTAHGTVSTRSIPPALWGLIILTFAEQDGKTKLTLQARAAGLVPIAAQMLEYMEAGWTEITPTRQIGLFAAMRGSRK